MYSVEWLVYLQKPPLSSFKIIQKKPTHMSYLQIRKGINMIYIKRSAQITLNLLQTFSIIFNNNVIILFV